MLHATAGNKVYNKEIETCCMHMHPTPVLFGRADPATKVDYGPINTVLTDVQLIPEACCDQLAKQRV
jgi:hypothetical protein